MARALVAARLSRATDGPDRIERDDEQARAWAEREGHEVVELAADAGVSGAVSAFKRPSLGPWLTDPALVVRYDVIVASTVDRLGRDARDSMELRSWAEANGKRLVILSPGMTWPPGPDDIVSPILWDLTARFAELELKAMKARHAKARDKIRENGAFVGKPPWGFLVVGERYNRQLVPDPSRVEVYRECVRRALSGATYGSIGKWLTAEGIEPPRGGPWSPVSVSNILRTPALKGQIKSENGAVMHRFDSLLTAGEWAALQKAMDGRKGRRGAQFNDTAMLTGVIRCGLCGGPMYRINSATKRADGSKNVCTYYRCKGPDKAPSTCRNSVSLSAVDAWVDQWFTFSSSEGVIGSPFADQEVVQVTRVPGDDHSAEIADVEDEIRSLDFDAPDYASRHAQLVAERARLRALPVAPDTVEEVGTGQTVAEMWAGLDVASRRAYLLASDMRVFVRTINGEYEATNFATGRHTVWIEGDPRKVSATVRIAS